MKKEHGLSGYDLANYTKKELEKFGNFGPKPEPKKKPIPVNVQCPVCNMGLAHKSYLKRHITSFHKDYKFPKPPKEETLDPEEEGKIWHWRKKDNSSSKQAETYLSNFMIKSSDVFVKLEEPAEEQNSQQNPSKSDSKSDPLNFENSNKKGYHTCHICKTVLWTIKDLNGHYKGMN